MFETFLQIFENLDLRCIACWDIVVVGIPFRRRPVIRDFSIHELEEAFADFGGRGDKNTVEILRKRIR